ncbi:MAG: methyltransferase regulatory domain-containing protein [Alphaproteobacteria bacterium]|nr:methyltransferase regulatory domain-containing protein [Alphaproteobacteria bacterium]
MTGLGGYVTDIPYLRGFKPMLAPAWLDHVALVSGFAPPSRQAGYHWCDLGCGQGVTAAILAATHPAGRFFGIDAMPVHIEHARRLAGEIGAETAEFCTADFAAALESPLPQFDYIVAHGVYTWVDEAARADLRRVIERRLKPGGLVYISYNAMPGWLRDLPFQRLVSELGAGFPGDSAARFAQAAAVIRELAAGGAPAFKDSYILRELAAHPDDYRPGYLVHEFMHAGWAALYVSDVRREMAAIGLRPVGSATLIENCDAWVLGAEAGARLQAIDDPDRRELVRDFWIDQRFRCDVFTRDAPRLDAAERCRRLFDSGLALARPASAVAYACDTPSGRLDYDTPAARAIVAGLAAGARSLAEIAAPGMREADLVRNALLLCAAGDVRPVETDRVPVAAINRALRRRLGGPEEIAVLALSCGTALDIDGELLGLSRGGADPAHGRIAEWRDFLALHGVSVE